MSIDVLTSVAYIAAMNNIPYQPEVLVADFTNCDGIEYRTNYIKREPKGSYKFITRDGKILTVAWYCLEFKKGEVK